MHEGNKAGMDLVREAKGEPINIQFSSIQIKLPNNFINIYLVVVINIFCFRLLKPVTLKVLIVKKKKKKKQFLELNISE